MKTFMKYPDLADKMFSMRIGEVLSYDHELEILRIFAGWIFIFKDGSPVQKTVSTLFIPMPS